MEPELRIILSTVFTSIGQTTLKPMFHPTHGECYRPGIFIGKWGEAFLSAIGFLYVVLPISLLVWSFINVIWYMVIVLVIGSFVVSKSLMLIFPRLLLSTVISPLLSLAFLCCLHNSAWFK